jgi:non-specific serine/threonine protein kinase
LSHAPLFVGLFGPPEFRVNGEPLPRLRTRKGHYILALLTLRHGREVDRGWLAGTLWPENDDRTALAYLRQALTDLRIALGDAAATCLLSPSPRTLRLNADSDLITFQERLKRGDTASLEQAVALYRGPLMEGWAEDWLLAERESCAQSYLNALETLAQEAIAAGENASALLYLRRIVAADPLRESASRSLIQALAATRDYAAVTQAYRELRLVLRREVNAEPDAETQALFTRLRAEARKQASLTPGAGVGENDRRQLDSGPAPERVTHRLVSLPHPLTEFIGRVREADAAKRALRTSRLVTLTGMGGVGKTRLAIHVAAAVADDFPDGVSFVDLSPLSDPALVAKTAAVALNIAEQAEHSLTQTICAYLRERQLLLVLDNCEHLPEECARFAATILSECPHVRILATSRQRLGITGETLVGVSPMALPDPTHLGDDKNAPGALLEYEAVRLFLDRAQRVNVNLHVTPPLLRSIAVICRRLDGIPLALELAAARMNVLEAEQIAVRLTERFRLLSPRGRGGDDRVLPARQRTLRAALDWSYDLLLPEEQRMLGQVCVFVGGWTLEAAEAVVGGRWSVVSDESNRLSDDAPPSPTTDHRPPTTLDVLDLLTGLAEHSLIVFELENGQARYRLLETVREYAQERLRESEEDEATRLRTKHRDFFLHLAEEARPHLRRPEQVEWFDRLDTEHDNLRAALDWCAAEATTGTNADIASEKGLRLAATLGYFWKIRGHYREGQAWLERFLAIPDTSADESRKRTRGGAWYWLGTLAYDRGDFATAHRCLEQSISLYREIGHERGLATAISNQGNIAYQEGDFPRARGLYMEALEFYRGISDTLGIASMLGSLGNIEQAEGNLTEALRLQEESLRLSRSLGDARMTAYTLHNLGRLARLEKNVSRARLLYNESLNGMHDLGDRRGVASLLNDLAFLSLEEGKAAEAGELLVEALQTLLELGNRMHMEKSVRGLAWHAWLQNDPEQAARLWGAASAAREQMGIPSDEDEETYVRVIAEARAALSPAAFDAAWSGGTALSLEDAARSAMAQIDARSLSVRSL